MSDKKPLPPQNCDPSTLGAPRKPAKSLRKRPEVEWVVQLGPFTDGQISAPELVRPLEGPTDWIIKPKNGEIQPFDANKPPEKNVIRKYLNVGALDQDTPNDLPKLGDSYFVDRVKSDVVVDLDRRVSDNEGTKVVEYRERIVTETITKTQTNTVDPNDGDPGDNQCPPCPVCHPDPPECKDPKPPCDDRDKDCDDHKPTCDDKDKDCDDHKPTCDDKDKDCDDHKPTCDDKDKDCDDHKPTCEDKDKDCDDHKPTCDNKDKACDDHRGPDANNDHAKTKEDTSITIDVLKNDNGWGMLSIKSAEAEHGTVEIKNNKLVYTPDEGFTGKDVITYTMGDKSCLTDDACVTVTVKEKPESCEPTPSPCTPTTTPCNTGCDDHTAESSSGSGRTHDHEYTGKILDLDSIMDHSKGSMVAQVLNSMSSSMGGSMGDSGSGHWGASCYSHDACAPCSPSPAHHEACAVA